MPTNHLAVLFGLTTAAIVSIQLPVQAAATNYQVESGTTSLSIDQNLLKSLDLSFESASSTTAAAPGFDFGFNILPPSSDPEVLGTNFTFSYDNATGAFAPVSGSIEHSGTLAFDVNTEKLALLSPLEIGNFSIGVENDTHFIRDTYSTGLRLFDLVPNQVEFADKNLEVLGIDVLVSQEFSNTLGYAAGTDVNLAGVKVGQAQIKATAVPESDFNSFTAVLMVAGAALAISQRHCSKKVEF